MREILFRAKRIDNGGWVEGYFAIGKWYLDEKERYAILPIDLCFYPHCEINEWIEIDPETVCQYTGLKDKNGKRIWENDIVVCKQYIDGNFIDYHIEFGFVEMKHGAYGLHRDRPDAYYRPFKDWLEDYEYEVLGNIFDNPELLKGGLTCRN